MQLKRYCDGIDEKTRHKHENSACSQMEQIARSSECIFPKQTRKFRVNFLYIFADFCLRLAIFGEGLEEMLHLVSRDIALRPPLKIAKVTAKWSRKSSCKNRVCNLQGHPTKRHEKDIGPVFFNFHTILGLCMLSNGFISWDSLAENLNGRKFSERTLRP